MESLHNVLGAFIDPVRGYTIELFGSGLIHHTYTVKKEGRHVYILQEVNHTVFKWPENISENIEQLSTWLKQTGSSTILPCPMKSKNGEHYHLMNGEQVIPSNDPLFVASGLASELDYFAIE